MSQKSRIRRALQDGKLITQKGAARDFNCWRLADVIFKLRKDGLDIVTEVGHGKNGSRFAKYRLRGVETKRAGRPRAAES